VTAINQAHLLDKNSSEDYIFLPFIFYQKKIFFKNNNNRDNINNKEPLTALSKSARKQYKHTF